MPNANRFKYRALHSMLLLVICFWASIISAIMGKAGISLLAIIGYAISVASVLHHVYGKTLRLRKKVVMFLAAEAIQLVPYAAILVIRELI